MTRNFRQPIRRVTAERILAYLRDHAEARERHFGALAMLGVQAPQPCPEWLREAGARAERYLLGSAAPAPRGGAGGADPGATT